MNPDPEENNGESSVDCEVSADDLPTWAPACMKGGLGYIKASKKPSDYAIALRLVRDERLKSMWEILQKRRGAAFLYDQQVPDLCQDVAFSAPELDHSLYFYDPQDRAIFSIFILLCGVINGKTQTHVIFKDQQEYEGFLYEKKIYIKYLRKEINKCQISNGVINAILVREQMVMRTLNRYKSFFVSKNKKRNLRGLVSAISAAHHFHTIFGEPFYRYSIIIGHIATGEMATYEQIRQSWRDRQELIKSMTHETCENGTI
ncbi:hypothetical protein [Acidiphilium rubrum]|uniref:hypothetical protein n=1 Tax=Acidiphilium rubrum TaxID=526 RepID=UPI002C4529A1|nr:hypothetical protein [Acidiphilium rubrum]HQT86369.1 hypothetical protein [Acidiphilium rubrum]